MAKVKTRLQTETTQNLYPMGRTYLYGLYLREHPPLPPPPPPLAEAWQKAGRNEKIVQLPGYEPRLRHVR